ncbi:acyl-CoA dehydrogenase family protein [Streptomyces sp. NPDC088253]|uniref:acyl-CoA dehydrogenase family protein n=1 Tax=Streptomyces sp. NPDC088253 TaxID=3365846 RepID=UPI00382283BE
MCVATGDLHVCFGVTKPEAGLDTTSITTFARRDGDHYVVNGRKVWISKAVESEKILLLTRTTKVDEVAKRTDGMTLFLTDLDRDSHNPRYNVVLQEEAARALVALGTVRTQLDVVLLYFLSRTPSVP